MTSLKKSTLILSKVFQIMLILSIFPQGMDLRQDLRRGVIMGNQSLVLQSLGRNATGNYYCVATNSEGTTFSNPVQLDIKCKKSFYPFKILHEFFLEK